MTNRTHHQLRKLNERLQETAHTKYVHLLRKLCLVHSNLGYTSKLYDLLRDENLERPHGWDDVIKLADSLSSQKYEDAWQHFQANQFVALIHKYPFSKDQTSFDPEEKARKKFFASEHKCSRVNARFVARRYRRGKAWPYEYEFQAMRDFISYVLGFQPKYENIWNKCGFGPGAAIGVHGNATNFWRKLSSNWTVSSGAYHYAYAAVMKHAQVREVLYPNPGGFTSGSIDYGPHGPYSKKVDVVAYNKIAFVPKTAKTHRVIAIEPLLNSFIQKGIDEHMRIRLKRIGIDLSDQSKNSEFARLGSLSGVEDPFCTIDLSSASDSIAIELVRELLPPEWFELLNSTRSKNFKLDGSIHSYHKFCSMGNGFCFPLETLLFAAASHACAAGRPGKDFLVYGDDIVVKQSISLKLIKLLAYMGFSVNSEKTFTEGPFRESCGRDWFGGIDVRPYTFKNKLDSLQSIFKAMNGMRRNDFTSLFFDSVRYIFLKDVPRTWQLYRPFPGPEDTAITSIQDEFLTCTNVRYRFKHGSGCWSWYELISHPCTDKQYLGRVDNASALMYAALVGSASDAPFALRRKTKTKVRLISHPGATSLWLPS